LGDAESPFRRSAVLRIEPSFTVSTKGRCRYRGARVTFQASDLFGVRELHQSQMPPQVNKFHAGNGEDGKHYWITPPELYAELDAEFHFDFDPCPFPLPDGFDGLTCEWGRSSYVNPPFGSIIHQGKKKGPTAWVRKAIIECRKGKRVVLVYPVDKWVLMLLSEILGDHAQVRNLGDVKWLATEDGSAGKGTGRHIACFILEPSA
jgi:hypothetical protein